MATNRKIAIEDLHEDHAQQLSHEDQERIAGGIKLENVYITSYQSSGSAGGDSVPMDSFSLNFEKVKYR